MADTKLSALPELAAAPAVGDEVYIRDISEAAADESKRITIANLSKGIGEQGTFTVTIQDNTRSDSESQAYGTRVAVYTKIGNIVWFSINFTTTSLGTLTTSEQAVLAGLPFTAKNTANQRSAVFVGQADQLAIPNVSENMAGQITENETIIRLTLWDATTGTSIMLLSEWSADGQAVISGHYETE